MRAWHLVGLRQADGERLRFRLPEGGTPLMLPASIPSGDQEQIIAFFQQVAGDEPLARVEIDWHRGILERQRDFLERTHTERGSSGVLLVIKVRAEGVDANEVLASGLVKRFEHVVVASAHSLAHERLTNLAALTKLVETTVRDAYAGLAQDMGLDPAAWGTLRPIVSLLLNPIDVVEAANALVEIQLEPEAPPDLGHLLKRRALARLLASRSPDELVALAAHAAGRVAEASALLEPERWKVASGGLERDLLLRGTSLRGWAAWVGLEGRPALADALAVAGQPTHEAARTATAWVAPAERALTGMGLLWGRILRVARLIDDGQLALAREELDAMEGEVAQPGTTMGDRGIYWAAVGRYRKTLGELREAEVAFRMALDLLKGADVPPRNRGVVQSDLGVVLSDTGRWEEAEAVFRDALLRLEEEGSATVTSRGYTLDYLAKGLRDNGRWAEAEAAFRDALRLKEEDGGAAAKSRGITLDHLARGLRDNGRWPEAEAAFREALRLKEEGGATAESRGRTLQELARGLSSTAAGLTPGRRSKRRHGFLQPARRHLRPQEPFPSQPTPRKRSLRGPRRKESTPKRAKRAPKRK